MYIIIVLATCMYTWFMKYIAQQPCIFGTLQEMSFKILQKIHASIIKSHKHDTCKKSCMITPDSGTYLTKNYEWILNRYIG